MTWDFELEGPCGGMRTPRHGLLGGPGPTHPDGRQAGNMSGGEGSEFSLEGAQESLNSGTVFQNQVALEARGGEGVLVRAEKGSEGVLTGRCLDREKKR